MRHSNMDDLNITLERRREIDAILKETQRKYENGEIKSMTLEEFFEREQKRWETFGYNLLEQEESSSETRVERLKNIITVFYQSKTSEEIYELIVSKEHYKNITKEEFNRLYCEVNEARKRWE